MTQATYEDCLEQACRELYEAKPAILHACNNGERIRLATEEEWLAYRVSAVHNGYRRAYIIANGQRCYVLFNG